MKALALSECRSAAARNSIELNVTTGSRASALQFLLKFWAALARAALVILFLAAAGLAQQPYSTLKQAGARNLLIVLNCKPADRPALRRAISTTSASQLSGLVKDGTLQSYRVLFNHFVDTETWDALIMLEFSGDAGVQNWEEIEENAPAGLDPDAAKLITAGTTYFADLVSHQEASRQDESQHPPGGDRIHEAQTGGDKPVYLVVPYTSIPTRPTTM